MVADLTQNSVEAKAQKVIVDFIESDTELSVTIIDNGEGMSRHTLKKIKDPFYTDGKKHTKRKIGMGIPLLIQTVTQANGNWNIESKENEGTTITMRFDLTNIDTPPIGDVPGLFRQLFTLPEADEMIIYRKKTNNTSYDYTLIRSQIIDALGGIETASELALLGKFLTSQEQPEN